MRAAAETFREELDAAAASGSDAVRSRMETAGEEVEGAISEAGRGMADLVTRCGQDLLSASGEFREKIRADLVETITQVVEQLDKMADRLKDGSGQIATAAGHIKSGGEATRSAAETLATASRDLQAAAGPVRTSVERIETATTGLAKSTVEAAETVTRSSRETAENAARVLDAAKAALSAEQKLIETSLTRLGEALDHMERQREQIDDMDEKLGADQAGDEPDPGSWRAITSTAAAPPRTSCLTWVKAGVQPAWDDIRVTAVRRTAWKRTRTHERPGPSQSGGLCSARPGTDEDLWRGPVRRPCPAWSGS